MKSTQASSTEATSGSWGQVPHPMSVVTLGTAGGPSWARAGDGLVRSGISTAVCVGDRTYLVDAGSGVGRQLMEAGIPLASVRGIFITHLHSDHIVDLGSLVLFGIWALSNQPERRIPIVGPGDRSELPPLSPRAASSPDVVAPHKPTPGVKGLFDGLMNAYATDLNDRIFDTLRSSPAAYFEPEEIVIPSGIGYHPNDSPTPHMEPFEVFRDDRVTVTATLVRHPPMAPAFAFRIESVSGSVVISGDTAPCENMVELARDADLLLHEALDFSWYEKRNREAAHSGRLEATMDHHRKSHTDPSEAVEIAESAGVRALALHHLVPARLGADHWRGLAEHFKGQLIIPNDLDVIDVTSIRESRAQ